MSLALWFACAPANAAPPDNVASVELLPGWTTADGSRMAGLRIKLAPGWKTYWRAPGDAGIPPQFSWSKSSNLSGVRVHWPRPDVFEQSGMRSIGYSEEVILPIEFIPGDAAESVEVSGQIALGVCKDVCLPVTLNAGGTLSGDGSQTDQRALKQALATRPVAGRSLGTGPVTCTIAPIPDGLRMTAHIPVPPQGGQEFVVFEAGRNDVWVSEVESRRDGATLIASADLVPPEAQPFAMDRSKLRITVLGRDGAVDLRGCKSG